MVDTPRSAARPVYSIGAVARMLDVRASTLRSWEERYGVVVPDRSKGSQRLYSRDQVEQVRFLVDQVQAGLQAGEAHRLLEAGHGAASSTGLDVDVDRPQLLILIAERDPFAAELTEFFLRTEGYEVVVAFDAADAAAQSQQQDVDLAIVELTVSAAAGTALCAELHDRGTAVLATSALGLGAEALLAGADAFLPKPFEPLQLVSTVRDLLGDSALTRAHDRRAAR